MNRINNIIKSKLSLVLLISLIHYNDANDDYADNNDPFTEEDNSIADESEEMKDWTQRKHPYERTGDFNPQLCTDITNNDAWYNNEYKDMPCQDKLVERKLIQNKKGEIQNEINNLVNRKNKNIQFNSNKDENQLNINDMIKENNEIIAKTLSKTLQNNINTLNKINKVPMINELYNIDKKYESDIKNSKEKVINVEALLNNSITMLNKNFIKSIDNVISERDNSKLNKLNDVKYINDMFKKIDNLNGNSIVKKIHDKDGNLILPKIKDIYIDIWIQGNKKKNNNNVNLSPVNKLLNLLPTFNGGLGDLAQTNSGAKINNLLKNILPIMNDNMKVGSLINNMLPLFGIDNKHNNENSKSIDSNNNNNKPQQRFYMKYAEFKPNNNDKNNNMKYEYLFFEQFMNNRYNKNNNKLSFNEILSNSIINLNEKLIRKPRSIKLNEKSVLKYKNNINNNDKYINIDKDNDNIIKNTKFKRDIANILLNNVLNSENNYILGDMNKKRSKRELKDILFENDNALNENERKKREVTTTDYPIFNEGPFKVEDKEDLKWVKDFLKQYPKEYRNVSYKVVHQEPPSTDPMQWYHPMDTDWTYWTVEPTVPRKTNDPRSDDLCEKHTH